MSNKRNRVDWRGYIPAIVTPFHADGGIDFGGLGVMLDWLHAEAMHGLVVAGTTGEWPSLAPEERRQLFSAVAGQMAGRLPLLAGCTAFRASDVLDYARHAADVGFEGILVTPPPYIRPDETEILGYYADISTACPLPICVYNWPPGTGIDMSLELLMRIAELDNVVALKQSTSDLRRFVATFFALNDVVRVFGHSMDEHGLQLLHACGGDGTMGAGAVLGRVHADFYNHLWAGDLAAARACGAKDRVIMDAWYTRDLVGRFGSGPAILKAGLVARGLPVGHVRKPLRDVSAAAAEEIRQTLATLGMVDAVDPVAARLRRSQ